MTKIYPYTIHLPSKLVLATDKKFEKVYLIQATE